LFRRVNPYEDKSKDRGSVFKIEHEADDRLRCLAVSAKRYAFYRFGDPGKGEPRVVIEKISAHGLGAYWDPPGYVSKYRDAPSPGKQESKTEPKRLGDIVASNAASTLSYDIWREAIEAIEFERREPPEERECKQPRTRSIAAAIKPRHRAAPAGSDSDRLCQHRGAITGCGREGEQHQ
jgi:hypothetical protein